MAVSFAGNRVVRDTGSQFPIFHAPIGTVARAPMVSAVSGAGGMGLLETTKLHPDELDGQAARIRASTARPFGVHLMTRFLSNTPEHAEAVLAWLVGQTSFVTTGYGDPLPFIQRVKDAGATIYHICGSMEEALRAEDGGVDGVVLSGAEKGGGAQVDQLHTFALLQQVRRRTDLPIVASGGIVDGFGMAAAFALGAEGILMGTRFIASQECPWHDGYKQSIADTDHVIGIDTESPLGIMRAVRTPFAEAVLRGEAGHKDNPYCGDTRALFLDGRTDVALVGCGETGVLVRDILPAGEIVRQTVREFAESIERSARLLANNPALGES